MGILIRCVHKVFEHFIFPKQNAVVVFTGGNYASADMAGRILAEDVMPAFKD
jgi:hypothetical protein